MTVELEERAMRVIFEATASAMLEDAPVPGCRMFTDPESIDRP